MHANLPAGNGTLNSFVPCCRCLGPAETCVASYGGALVVWPIGSASKPGALARGCHIRGVDICAPPAAAAAAAAAAPAAPAAPAAASAATPYAFSGFAVHPAASPFPLLLQCLAAGHPRLCGRRMTPWSQHCTARPLASPCSAALPMAKSTCECQVASKQAGGWCSLDAFSVVDFRPPQLLIASTRLPQSMSSWSDRPRPAQPAGTTCARSRQSPTQSSRSRGASQVGRPLACCRCQALKWFDTRHWQGSGPAAAGCEFRLPQLLCWVACFFLSACLQASSRSTTASC